MTNLKKLTEKLNLEVLNSGEKFSLKGGRMAKALINNTLPPPVKPVSGGGGGLPPNLDNVEFSLS